MAATDQLAAAEAKAAKAAAYVNKLRVIKQAEQEIPGAYRTGEVTMQKLADQYAISPMTVRRILKDANVPTVKFQRLSDEQRAEIVQMLRAGEHSDAVATAYGVSRNTVRKVGLDAGVFTKGSRRPHRSDADYALIEAYDAETRARFNGAGLYNLGMGLKQWRAKKAAEAAALEAESAPAPAPAPEAEVEPEGPVDDFGIPETSEVSLPATVGTDASSGDDPYEF